MLPVETIGLGTQHAQRNAIGEFLGNALVDLQRLLVAPGSQQSFHQQPRPGIVPDPFLDLGPRLLDAALVFALEEQIPDVREVGCRKRLRDSGRNKEDQQQRYP
jgi:hypothetical protein